MTSKKTTKRKTQSSKDRRSKTDGSGGSGSSGSSGSASSRSRARRAGGSSRATKGKDDSARATADSSTNRQKSRASQQKRTSSKKGSKKTPLEGAPTLGKPPRRRSKSKSETHGAAGEKSDARPENRTAWNSNHTSDVSDDESQDVFLDDVGMLGIGSRVFPPDMDEGLFDDDTDHADVSPTAAAEAVGLSDDASVEARIRDIEARLEGLMADESLDPLDALEEPPSERTPESSPGSAPESAVDAARELLESDYYRRKWGRGSLRDSSYEVDDFGLDPEYETRLRPLLEFLFKKYFRVDVEGVEHIPDAGRAVVVANHSGALPFDGAMLREASRIHHPAKRDLRWLAEDYSFYLPFIGVTLNRIGAVRACQENAERLLSKGHVVGVFPEGAEGLKKLYKDRYKLQRFGRGGFVRLCLKTNSPIVPCAIVGAEETNPIIYRFDNLSKLVGLDYLPITPTFPLLGPFGLLPAPTKWRMLFGEPISVSGYGPEAANDHVLVGRLSERVRTSIHSLLETGLRRRKSVWL